MNINKKIIIFTGTIMAISSLASTLPLFAEAKNSTATTTNNRVGGGNIQERVQKWQAKGGIMIDNRIQSLNALIDRIQGMKMVSEGDKTSLRNELQTEIMSLTSVRAHINSDTSTSSLKADIDSITKSYRVFALVEPQARITASADRILNIVATMKTTVSKIQSRLANDSSVNASSSIQSALSDMISKINDAEAQARAAISEIAPLKPDNGDKTVMTANTAALKDARSKIQAANKDLMAARKDAGTIVNALRKDAKLNTNTASSTAASSTTASSTNQ